jgi:hypothetical protein
MKSINYALLVSLSSFMLTACGGGSSSAATVEASADDVAVLIPIEESTEDMAITTRVEESTEVDYSKVDWIPEETNLTDVDKLSYNKVSYSINPTIQKVESDGTDPDKWSLYSVNGGNPTITSVYDEEKGSDVIEFNGDGVNNGYMIGYSFNTNTGWNDTVNKTIKWSMKFNEEYIIYVRVSTTDGYRYLYYTANNQDYGISSYDAPHYIHNGLGSASDDGQWVTVSRNLSADLNRFERMNEIISVDGFFVRGSGRVDDLELLSTEATVVNETIYEDAEDSLTTGWSIYDANPAGAEVKNVVDADTGSNVIELTGDGINNGFVLGSWDDRWDNTINKEISWDLKTDNNYVIYVSVLTTDGHRFMTYSPLSDTTYAKNPDYQESSVIEVNGYTYVNHYLPPSTRSDAWNTIARNLETDLKDYEPDNSLVSVSGFLVRGDNLRLDNIKMFDTNTDGDFDNSTN